MYRYLKGAFLTQKMLIKSLLINPSYNKNDYALSSEKVMAAELTQA